MDPRHPRHATLGAAVARLWVHDPASGVLRAAGSFGVHRDLEAALLDIWHSSQD
jgi:hypothetical protein